MGQSKSKQSDHSSTTIEPERYHHRHYHHPEDHLPIDPVPASPRPRFTTTVRPVAESSSNGLGFASILFIGIGAVVIILVFVVCLIVTWRHCKRRKLQTWKQESEVGRAIQRRSFFPRFSRYRNQPVVLNYPDPYSHLPNYPIETPYTFSSSSTLADSTLQLQTREHKNIPDVPSYRATVY